MQVSVKMTKEPPRGLRANLKTVFLKMDDDKLNRTNKPGTISASRGAAVPSRHRCDSSPSEKALGGLFFDSEAVSRRFP